MPLGERQKEKQIRGHHQRYVNNRDHVDVSTGEVGRRRRPSETAFLSAEVFCRIAVGFSLVFPGTVKGQIIITLSIPAASKRAIDAAKLLSLRCSPALLTGDSFSKRFRRNGNPSHCLARTQDALPSPI